jgi:hypothetical protein
MADLAAGKTAEGDMYIIKSPDLRKQICERYPGGFLALVNGEWVFAPGFDRQSTDYPDITLTGSNSNCARMPLTDFIHKYSGSLLVFSVMDDISTLVTPELFHTLQTTGLTINLPVQEGQSYSAVTLGGKVIHESVSPQKIEWADSKADGLPVDLKLTSAGRISGEEDAVILVNGRDYSYHQPGLNVAVIDSSTGLVTDTALFSATAN